MCLHFLSWLCLGIWMEDSRSIGFFECVDYEKKTLHAFRKFSYNLANFCSLQNSYLWHEIWMRKVRNLFIHGWVRINHVEKSSNTPQMLHFCCWKLNCCVNILNSNGQSYSFLSGISNNYQISAGLGDEETNITCNLCNKSGFVTVHTYDFELNENKQLIQTKLTFVTWITIWIVLWAPKYVLN